MITLNSSRATFDGLHIIRAFSMIWPWCIIQECKGGRSSYHYWRIKFLSSTVMLMFCKKHYPTLFCFAICYFNLLWVLLFNLSIVIYLSLVNTSKSIHLYNSSPDFNYFVPMHFNVFFSLCLNVYKNQTIYSTVACL